MRTAHIRPLLEQAATVRVTADRLSWRDWERYSNRQGRKMTLGGFVGEMEIEGDLAPLVSLLRTAELLHVGKGATFAASPEGVHTEGRLRGPPAPGFRCTLS